MFNISKNASFSTDLENNLLCPNSFIKISNLDPFGPPEINSKFKSINKMADIISKNYNIAKKVRDQEIINSLHHYKILIIRLETLSQQYYFTTLDNLYMLTIQENTISYNLEPLQR